MTYRMAVNTGLMTYTLVYGYLLLAVSGIPDWLVENINIKTTIVDTPGSIDISNGIISRKFITLPDFTTVDYYSYEKQSSVLRAIDPEATIFLDGIEYNIGGLNTSIPRAYLNRTALAGNMDVDEQAFHYVSHEVNTPIAPFPYTPSRSAPQNIAWPPKGLRLDVRFQAPPWAPLLHKLVSVVIHYEMYDGMPLMTKWLTVEARDAARGKVMVTIGSVEDLAVNWQWAQGGYGWLYIQTDQAHNTVVDWNADPSSSTMPGSFERTVRCSYSQLPYLPLDPDFVSFRALELLIGSADHERSTLAKRKMMRLLAPHTQENPIFFHMVHTDSESVRSVIDQMAEVGFEMLIFSFGSGFNYESHNETYIQQLAADVAYAKARNIEVGGYDLIASTRQVKSEWMAKYHGYPSACFASGWYDFLLDSVLNMMDKTGMTFIETDGPYSGYPCAATNHAHHRGYSDSVYKQTMLQNKFYTILRSRGVYINQPDIYFYQGGSKTAMGYDESQYSLPRWQDISISRQGMFDDTFHYIPTVGWMFVPMVVYHAGGNAAMFEPLQQNSAEYTWALAQYLGAGVAACYRGYRLYDTNATKAIVQHWVTFYKTYRRLLISDIIHIRRADMQGIDCYMHVNPTLVNKALAMVFNPTLETQRMNLTLPLYYSGITSAALVGREGARFVQYTVDRQYNIVISLDLPPLGITWYVIQGK